MGQHLLAMRDQLLQPCYKTRTIIPTSAVGFRALKSTSSFAPDSSPPKSGSFCERKYYPCIKKKIEVIATPLGEPIWAPARDIHENSTV
jgi:hypothetical protein